MNHIFLQYPVFCLNSAKKDDHNNMPVSRYLHWLIWNNIGAYSFWKISYFFFSLYSCWNKVYSKITLDILITILVLDSALCFYLCSMFYSGNSGDQTYKNFLSPFSKFWSFWFISYNRFSDLLFHLSLPFFISILTWAGRKNVGTIIN